MTADDFRAIALSFPEAEERMHMNHPDFRVNGHIFATLNYPHEGWAMVRLTSDQQQSFVEADSAFVSVKGAWGLKGCTNVLLEKAKKSMVRSALAEAWQVTSTRKPARKKPATTKPTGARKKKR